MSPVMSSRALGLIRELLTAMQPEDSFSTFETNLFWRDTLFDADFSQDFIDFGTKYSFNWSLLIPELRSGKFPNPNPFSPLDPGATSREMLEKLAAFLLDTHHDSPMAEQLKSFLNAEGFASAPEPGVVTVVPTELAQLPNQERLRAELTERLTAEPNVSVLFIDCDGFKGVNDTLGHAAGDRCLILAARLMTEAIIGKGKLYRCGGDEFAVILPNSVLEEAAATAERIRKAIDRHSPGGEMKVTVSIGVANSQTEKTTKEATLIHAADLAMYEAKKRKNAVSLSNPQ